MESNEDKDGVHESAGESKSQSGDTENKAYNEDKTNHVHKSGHKENEGACESKNQASDEDYEEQPLTYSKQKKFTCLMPYEIWCHIKITENDQGRNQFLQRMDGSYLQRV